VKLFITGISGLLGLNFALQVRDHFTVSGAFHSHPVSPDGCETMPLDVTSLQAVEDVLGSIRPDVVVHTAALTDVERCEANSALAHQLNEEAARHVARSATAVGAQLVHISTDHLFDGSRPWATETDPPTPINAYATTKRLAERAVLEECPDALIIRTNFFGWGTSIRPSFSDWILKSLEQHLPLTMFNDVFFTPILINELVDLIIDLILRRTKGTFHVAGAERLTKYDFALKLAAAFGHTTEGIAPVSIDDFAFSAVRPKDMSISSKKVESYLGVAMPPVAVCLEGLKLLRQNGWPQLLACAIAGPAITSPSPG